MPERRLPAPLPDEYVAEPKMEKAEAEEAAADESAAEEAEEPEYYIPPEEMEELERLQENVGPIASWYLSPYMQRSRYLDTEFGIRQEDDGSFMIGNSPISGRKD